MKLFKLTLILFFIALPLIASGAEKAKTIDELVQMYDVSSCKRCHKKQYAEWENSTHAKPLIGTGRTLGGFKGFITAGLMGAFTKSGVKDIKDIKMDHFAMCFKCHLPQALTSGTDELARQFAKAFVDGDKETLGKVSINCNVCHTTKALIHKWQDGEPERNVTYGPSLEGDHDDKMTPKMKKSVIMKDSVMCGQCHGTGPNFEFPQPSQCATIYGSYLHSYIPAGGTKTCQDCHMKESGKGHLMPAYRDTDMRKMGIQVEVETFGYKFLPKAGDLVPTALVTVRMTNKAGHRTPDG